ncbi:hypothetical protein E4U43_007697 [Claviceps pusilla]|uniref:Methyltransferase domain-containing protein n=1 Tax=Claviceps pusilla TaxID=123648 RepID=A0A9P7NCD6_9HYPO|nr:hypothetical protein E4U43_007697 [Claviceps pusilla]
MKICIISLAKDQESRLDTHHELPDPAQYIPRSRHEFVYRQVTKQNAKSEIDALCSEDFCAFINCMSRHVDGIKATKHLESKNVTVLTNPSDLSAKSQLDLGGRVSGSAFSIPQNTHIKYPKMVKFLHKPDSPGLDAGSVCPDEHAVKRRITLLQEQDPTLAILVQDYIYGDDCAALVMDLGGHVIALPPLQFVFPRNTSADAEFLTRDDKTGGVTARDISSVIVEGRLAERMQKAAVDAFKTMQVSHGGAFAHVTMRVERDTQAIYVMDIDCNPSILERKGRRFNGDFLLETTFPGKQEAFIDTLLTIKPSQLGSIKGRITHTAAFYDSWSETYDDFWESTNMSKMQQFTAANFDFSGSVLDLACGTGVFGRILHDHDAKTTEIVGVEISAGMLCAPDIRRYYKKPLWNCSMQEYVMNNVEFDHVVCFGALLFLNAVELNTVLARMFMMARKSLTIEVENLNDDVIELMRKDSGDHVFIENHVQIVERFGIPGGWKLVYKQNGALYPSPTSEGNVEGYIVRFEKISSQ